METQKKIKIVWGFTGSGYLIKESIDLMKELQETNAVEFTIILSTEGAAVVKWYRQWIYLTETIKKVLIEKTPNNPFLAGPLQIGKYKMLIICPVSANSAAKIAYGIADTLITNCVAQTIKGGIPVYLNPSDQDNKPIETTKPNGQKLTLKIRDIEIENVEKLKKMEGITVFRDLEEIKKIILSVLESD
jgi:archaeoflavoprotein AfpA